MMLGCTLRLVSKSLCWMTRCSRESRSRGTGADSRRLSVCSASSSFDCSVDNCSVSTRTAFLPSSTSKHKYKLHNTELEKRRVKETFTEMFVPTKTSAFVTTTHSHSPKTIVSIWTFYSIQKGFSAPLIILTSSRSSIEERRHRILIQC